MLTTPYNCNYYNPCKVSFRIWKSAIQIKCIIIVIITNSASKLEACKALLLNNDWTVTVQRRDTSTESDNVGVVNLLLCTVCQ